MPKDRPRTPAKGLYAALLTPRKEGAMDADVAQMLDYIDRITDAGVDGLVLFGATGEFIHFGIEERIRVSHLAIRRSRVPVLVNVSYSGLAGVLTLAESAIYAGAAGLMLMPPYFYRYGQEDIYAFYQSAFRAIESPVPIYLYNLPQFTNTISADLAYKLLASPPVAGIKDSSGDLPFFGALKALRAERSFSLLIGNEKVYAQERAGSADGIVSGIAAALPELIAALESAITAKDFDRVHALNTNLEDFLRWLDQFPATVGIKQTAAFRGWIKGDMAFPLSGATQAALANFRNWLKVWLPQLLRECSGSTPVKARS
jgi:dihydrodipicolinate synthase/N-acetylneuraminate lyase